MSIWTGCGEWQMELQFSIHLNSSTVGTYFWVGAKTLAWYLNPCWPWQPRSVSTTESAGEHCMGKGMPHDFCFVINLLIIRTKHKTKPSANIGPVLYYQWNWFSSHSVWFYICKFEGVYSNSACWETRVRPQCFNICTNLISACVSAREL